MIDEKRFTGAVAVLDILGFANRSRIMGLNGAFDCIVGALLKAAMDAETMVNEDLGRAERTTRLQYVQFADTLALLLEQEPGSKLGTPARVVDSIVFACAMMTATSMWLEIPLRGAIAYGDCLVCLDPVCVLGDPFLDAHILGARLEWAGVVLCESAEAMLDGERNHWLVKWDVPVRDRKKEQLDSKPFLVVNWPSCSLGPSISELNDSGQLTPGPQPNWDLCFPGDCPHVARIKQHTVDFFLARQAAPFVGGPKVGPEQRDLIRYWRQMYSARQRMA